jgi:hypothetical protein
MIMLPTITATALNALNESAIRIQAELLERRGDRVEIPDLNEVLAQWLEGAIEQLCQEACECCVTGDRNFAVNRDGFEAELARVSVVNIWEEEAEVVQLAQDQRALGLERAA